MSVLIRVLFFECWQVDFYASMDVRMSHSVFDKFPLCGIHELGAIGGRGLPATPAAPSYTLQKLMMSVEKGLSHKENVIVDGRM